MKIHGNHKYGSAFMVQAVCMAESAGVREAARRLKINPTQITRWRKAMGLGRPLTADRGSRGGGYPAEVRAAAVADAAVLGAPAAARAHGVHVSQVKRWRKAAGGEA